MSNSKKTFDAVAMMRAQRDKISAQLAGMTLEEELAWLESQTAEDPKLQRLLQRKAQQPGSTVPTPRDLPY